MKTFGRAFALFALIALGSAFYTFLRQSMATYIQTFVLTFALTFSMSAPTLAHAEEYCLSRHLRDAIQLNHVRLPRYSALTHGESEVISRRLLRFETIGLLPAALIDFQALHLQKKGISIVCDELVSMSSVPEFSEKSPLPADPISQFQPLNAHRITSSIREAYHREGFEAVSRVTQDWLQVINQTPSYHCLVRHFLDSIVRTANLAPMHIEQGRKVNSHYAPARLSWELIETQLIGLGEMERIDELAAPIQAQGIPMLCQDVPRIPPGL